MDIAKIVLLLKNAGLQNIKVGNGIIEFDDPACIYTAFDNILEFGWIVIVFFTAIMLFGWALLYIKNGIKINTVFNNAKSMILIFCILSAIKPIVNVIYGDNLFARNCDRKSVSLPEVQQLLELRNKTLSQSAETELYEIFDMKDSGIVYDSNNLTAPTSSYAQSIQNNYSNTSLDSSDYSVNTAENINRPSGTSSGFIRATYSRFVTIYINARGERIQRSGGSVAWRNNNPGNIRKSKSAYSFGAIGETDKWAVFPDEETGLNAIVKLLRSKNYNNLSVAGAIHRWAPSSDGNNPERYARKVSKMTGLPADAKINSLTDSDLQKVANAIKVIEGWNVGKEEKI